jgi:leucyl-tRNA synthetase
VSTEADKNVVEKLAIADDNVSKFIDGKEIRKIIVVPGRLVNIVVAG